MNTPLESANERCKYLAEMCDKLQTVLTRIRDTPAHELGQTPNEYHFQEWAREALSQSKPLQISASVHDRAVIRMHQTIAQRVKNMKYTGLTAQDMIEGVTLSHNDYLALFDLAKRGFDNASAHEKH
jgi:hypothetical protein